MSAPVNGVLHHAHWPQVPAFIWAPEEEGQFQPGRCSRWWLLNSLKALEAEFKALGSSLTYRCAPESRTALLQLVQETGAQVRAPGGASVLPRCPQKACSIFAVAGEWLETKGQPVHSLM